MGNTSSLGGDESAGTGSPFSFESLSRRRSRPFQLQGGNGSPKRSSSVPPEALDTLLPPSSKVAAAKTTSSRSSNSLKSFSKKVAKKFRSSSALRSQKSKHKDQIRVFRDMISGWSLQQLSCLVAEFQSAAALRELALTSDLARRHSPTLAEDLNKLLESGSWTYDVNLRYGNLRIPAHRCILANRCAFFRQLLRNNSNHEVDVVLPDDVKLDDENFRALIRYLYTGDVQTTWSCSPTALRTFIRLKQKFGSPHTLEYDLFSMWRDRLDTDAVLIFVPSARFEHSISAEFSSAENESQAPSPYLRSTSTINRHREVKCHSVVLAARSGFFRRLIQRRHCAKEFDASKPMRIMLDESVIHRQYSNLLLQACYTDELDFSQMLAGCRNSMTNSSLNEVKAIASGKSLPSPLHEATEIYAIARYIEFELLAQNCEDVIVRNINSDTFLSIYSWATESFGSAFVQRQCERYCRDHFNALCNGPLLFDFDEQLMVHTLNSDFVQATELDIVEAVVRWGEAALVRRLEEREPNILSGTTHSISRRGVKRSELPGDELREIVSNVMPTVRTDFVLPAEHPALISAIKRGLIFFRSCDPGLGFESDFADSATESVAGCDRDRANDDWVHGSARPRLFWPYFEEARKQFQQRLAESPAEANALIRHSTAAPHKFLMRISADFVESFLNESKGFQLADDCAVDSGLICAMLQQMQEIQRNCNVFRRATCCGCAYHRAAASKQVRLRVVRENGFPDEMSDFLGEMIEELNETRVLADPFADCGGSDPLQLDDLFESLAPPIPSSRGFRRCPSETALGLPDVASPRLLDDADDAFAVANDLPVTSFSTSMEETTLLGARMASKGVGELELANKGSE